MQVLQFRNIFQADTRRGMSEVEPEDYCQVRDCVGRECTETTADTIGLCGAGEDPAKDECDDEGEMGVKESRCLGNRCGVHLDSLILGREDLTVRCSVF